MKLSNLIEQSKDILPSIHTGKYFEYDDNDEIRAACVLGRIAYYLNNGGMDLYCSPTVGDFLSAHLGYDLVHETSKDGLKVWNKVTEMSDLNKPVSEIVQWLRERGY